MKSFKEKKGGIVSDILENYHYSYWVKLTHKRIDEIPEKLEVIYRRFGELMTFPATSTKEQKQQLVELKQIHKELKKYYRKKILS